MVILFAAVAAQAVPFQQTYYWHCLMRATERLEVSGERPRDVADAALDLCHSQEPDYSPRMAVAMHDVLVEKLADRVVEIRAARR